MDKFVERIINEFPMKISKSDTTLNPDGGNILKKVTAKVWVEKKLNSYILR